MINELKDFYSYDIALVPFFVNETRDKRAMMVSIKSGHSYQIDLFDRDRGEISDKESNTSKDSNFKL